MARAELFEHFFGGYILSGLGAFGPFVNLQLVEKYFAHLFGRRKVETLACKGKDFLFQFVHAQGEQLGCLAQRFGIDTHAGEFHGCEHAHERHFHFFEQLNCVVAHELVVKCVLEPQCYVGVLACVLVDAGWEVAHVFLLLALRAYEFFDFYGRVTEVLLGERVHVVRKFGLQDVMRHHGVEHLSFYVYPVACQHEHVVFYVLTCFERRRIFVCGFEDVDDFLCFFAFGRHRYVICLEFLDGEAQTYKLGCHSVGSGGLSI